MANIIEQISEILRTSKTTTSDSYEIYDDTTSANLNELIPEFLDPSRTVIVKAIRYILKVPEDEDIYFVNKKLKIKRKQITKEDSAKKDVGDSQSTITLSLYSVLDELGLMNAEMTNDVKEKIRAHIRDTTDLYEKDMILILNEKIIIKKFNRQAEVKQEDQRFNGLPQQELNILRAKLFGSPEIEEKFLTEVMQKAMAVDLNFAVIGGDNFQKNYVKKIQKHIYSGLGELSNEDTFIIEGLGNLILRENWIFVHKLMSKRILDLVGEKVAGAESFLRYFKGDVVLGDDGNRYRLPEIIDINGTKWSASMMFGMVLQQKKSKLHKQELESASREIKVKMEACSNRIKEIEKETIKARDEIAEVEKEMAEMYDADKERDATLKSLNQDIQQAQSPEETQALKARYMELMGEMKRSVSKEYTLKSKKKSLEDIAQTAAARINKLNQELAMHERKIKEEEAKVNKFVLSLKALNDKYNIMLEALSSALMRRKTKVTEMP